MILTAVLTGVFVFLACVSTLLIVIFRFNREKQAFLDALRGYFEPPDNETQSQFATLTDILSERFAQKVTNTLKASFMGMQSVDAKNIQRLEGDMVQDVATQANPVLGAILTSFPTVSRRLAKNPNLLPLVQNLMAKGGGPGSGVVPSNSAKRQTDTFSLSKF